MQSTSPERKFEPSEIPQPLCLPSESHSREPTAEDPNSSEIIAPSKPKCDQSQLEEALKSAREFLRKSNFEESLNILEETLKLAIDVYGEESYEAARFHFEVGDALLCKIESSPDAFGDVVKDGEQSAPENNEEEEKEEQVEEVASVKTSNAKTMIIGTSKDDKKINKKDRVEITHEKGSRRVPGGGVDQKGETEEEVDDLQVAWEHLEVARVFLEKLMKGGEESDSNDSEEKLKIKKKLSQVYARLGDLESLNENFEAAIKDYNESLEIRKYQGDRLYDRELAEIHYLLGNNYLYKDDNCEEVALGHFNKARIILENCLSRDMGSDSKKDGEDQESHKMFMSRELLKVAVLDTDKIRELKEILSELYNKIEDTQMQKEERAR